MPETGSEILPTEEVVEALTDYQQRTTATYETHADDPEACVKNLIRLHLGWTEEDPDRARLVSRYRNPVMAGPGRERLTESNTAYFEQTKRWMERSRESGAMPALSFNILHALVFAPTQELAKLWLGGRLKRQPTEYADAMGDAAWAGITAAGAALERSPLGTEPTTEDSTTGDSR